MAEDLIDESKVNEEFEKLSNTSKYKRFAFWFLVVFFGGLVVWASVVPLQEGVPTTGMVVIDTKKKEVAHSSGGVIKEIYVKEGEFVEKEQILLKLKDATPKSDVEIENNKIKSLEENIIGQKLQLKSYEQLMVSKSEQLKSIDEELSGVIDLVKEGFAPKVKQLELERRYSELSSRNDEIFASKETTSQNILDLNYRLKAAKERRKKAERKLAGTIIKAGVSGQVMGIKKQSQGAVLRAGEKIMDLVPKNEQLFLEAQVKPNLIDRVRVGHEVDVRFSSFSLTPLLVVPGEITSISTDVIEEPKMKSPYYLARVRLTDAAKTILGKRKIQPGMQVEIVIKTGERTLLEYILHPLTRRVAFSLKEE
ncbi:MAG: HlyD family efflux transporter periplasmic adaptor subunit [Burkholderiaceae bacterium]